MTVAGHCVRHKGEESSKLVKLREEDLSLRASSPFGGYREKYTRERREAARGRRKALSLSLPRPRSRVSSRVPLARVLFTISPKWRACSQARKT